MLISYLIGGMCNSFILPLDEQCFVSWIAGPVQCFTTVGTSGLGYPLLLCLGESLIVILDYALTA